MGAILDSGERTEFATGALRDMHEGKGVWTCCLTSQSLRFLSMILQLR